MAFAVVPDNPGSCVKPAGGIHCAAVSTSLLIWQGTPEVGLKQCLLTKPWVHAGSGDLSAWPGACGQPDVISIKSDPFTDSAQCRCCLLPLLMIDLPN
jgi:hypothetical protein